MQEEVLMFPLTDKFDDIFQQFAIFLTALFAGGLLGILLQSPYGPKQYIRMLHLVNLVSCRLIIDEAYESLFPLSSSHLQTDPPRPAQVSVPARI